ncbi:hypothetical protein, partial [Hominenteromicrobium sp.]|uniref:hypothetical protein n=1 Tax=Hominenteromicrobium sp. TaxID=3073581 RepID=UPI003AB1FFA1
KNAPCRKCRKHKKRRIYLRNIPRSIFGLHAAMPCAQNEKAVLRRTAEKTLVNRVLYSITDFQRFVKSGLQILTTKKPRRTAEAWFVLKITRPAW